MDARCRIELLGRLSEQAVEPGFMNAFLVTPVMVDASLVWYLDDDGDGINDLMIDLDPLAGLYPLTESVANAINNQGQAVG